MYEDISLRFYRGSTEIFELYTHYLYEKIFGESFVLKLKDKLGTMRENFFNRFKDKRHCLIQLTEAQDRLFAALDARMPEYRAIRTPTLIMAGAEDRTIPPWVQRKLCGILPNTRFELVADSGHCVYIEQPGVFFGNLKRIARAKDLGFEGEPAGS
jgi:pimeloyl-ACP methyl ester carboxylesterase